MALDLIFLVHLLSNRFFMLNLMLSWLDYRF